MDDQDAFIRRELETGAVGEGTESLAPEQEVETDDAEC